MSDIENNPVETATNEDLRSEAENARREAEIERRANRTKTLFLANISHEMRTPLNAILGYAELLLTDGVLPTPAVRDVRRIAEAGRTLLEIVNNLLDLTKVESGQFTVRNDLYETKRLIDELSACAVSRIGKKPIAFSVECADDLPDRLYGDAVLTKQVVMNLLSNAAKYTESGYITMRVIYRGGLLSIEVRDTGSGIRREDMARIFEKFERLDSAMSQAVEGTGLGLALVKQLVNQMGGSVSVESTPGSGSVFTVTIPQGVGGIPKSAENHNLKFAAPGIKILLVDDNNVNLTVAKRLFERYELEVDCAENGLVCLDLLKQNPGKYDLVFLDHMMPDPDGVETLRRLRALPGCGGLTVISLTANAMKGMREFFLKNGFDDYMPKPISLQSVGSMLKKWLPPERLVAREPEEPETEDYPDALSKCTGIDVGAAMSYTDNYLDLMSVINDFYCLIEDKSATMEKAVVDGDLKTFTIEVHALKSSARLIGATELSDIAADLEKAGIAFDIHTVRRLTPRLLELYRGCLISLKPAHDALKSRAPKVCMSPAALKKELDELRARLDDFDIDSADIWSDRAASYLVDNDIAENLAAVRYRIRMIDYQGAINEIDKLSELL